MLVLWAPVYAGLHTTLAWPDVRRPRVEYNTVNVNMQLTRAGIRTRVSSYMRSRISPVRGTLADLCRKLGFQLFNCRQHYAEDGLFTYHNPRFQETLAFRSAYDRGVLAGHGVDPNMQWRLHVALWAASTAVRLPGDFVECGVNAGFISSAIMRYLDWNRRSKRYFLIDTFEGPVINQYSSDEVQKGRVTIAEAAIRAGAYVTDLGRIKLNFAEWERAIVVQGAVPDVLQKVNVDSIAFLHLDMNCAFPERAALEALWDRVASGGVILLDDYAYIGHECQAESIEEFACSNDASILALPTGQGLIIR